MVLLVLLSLEIGYTAGVAPYGIIRSITVVLCLFFYSVTFRRRLGPQRLACIDNWMVNAERFLHEYIGKPFVETAVQIKTKEVIHVLCRNRYRQV